MAREINPSDVACKWRNDREIVTGNCQNYVKLSVLITLIIQQKVRRHAKCYLPVPLRLCNISLVVTMVTKWKITGLVEHRANGANSGVGPMAKRM